MSLLFWAHLKVCLSQIGDRIRIPHVLVAQWWEQPNLYTSKGLCNPWSEICSLPLGKKNRPKTLHHPSRIWSVEFCYPSRGDLSPKSADQQINLSPKTAHKQLTAVVISSSCNAVKTDIIHKVEVAVMTFGWNLAWARGITQKTYQKKPDVYNSQPKKGTPKTWQTLVVEKSSSNNTYG